MNMDTLGAIMNPLSLVATIGLVLAFGAAGLVQLVGPNFVRRAYLRWECPATLYRYVGALELLTAILLAIPATRLLGVGVGAATNFVAVVTLLKNREYRWALPGLLVAVALPVILVTTLQQP